MPGIQTHEIITQPYRWDLVDGRDGESTELYCWSLDRQNKPHCIRFPSPPVFCQVELPLIVDNQRRTWTEDDILSITNYINQSVLREKEMFKMEVVNREKLYYYNSNQKYLMLRLHFRTEAAMQKCEYHFTARTKDELTQKFKTTPKPIRIKDIGTVNMRFWHTDITTIRRLLTLKDGQYSQWFKINAVKVSRDDCITTIESGEYVANWNDYIHIPMEQTTTWTTNPKELSIDYEVTSENHKRFPNSAYITDAIFACSCVVRRYKMPETEKRYIIVWGNPDETKVDGDVIVVRNELELLRAKDEIIRKEDPEIITGYNILKFDFPYEQGRLEMMTGQELGEITRLKGVKAKIKEIKWSSSAFSDQNYKLLDCPGRINIDLLPVVAQNFTYRKYDLDTVGKAQLGRGKHPIKPAEMFETFDLFIRSKNLFKESWYDWLLGPNPNSAVKEDLRPFMSDKQIRNNTILLGHALMNEKLVEKIRTSEGYVIDDYSLMSIWKQAPNVNGIVDSRLTKIWVRIHDYIKMRYQIKDIRETLITSYSYLEARAKMSEVLNYCLEDARLCLDIFDKINGWVALVMLSNVLGVSIEDTFLQGQSIKVISQLYDFCTKNDTVMDSQPASTAKMSGGYVPVPKQGLWDWIPCFDFNSLYPSIMMANNICFTTFVNDPRIPDHMCNIIEFEETDAKTGVKTPYRFRFIKKEYKEGLLPRMVRLLVTKRKEVKKQLKNAKDEIAAIQEKLKDIVDKMQIDVSKAQIATLKDKCVQLDKLQDALKKSANSIFGFTGQRVGKYPFVEVGMSITAYGRKYIHIVEKYFEDLGYETIYGDTDSNMPNLRYTNGKEAWAKAKEMAKELSALFPDDLNMECEKIMRILAIRKKGYAYLPVDEETGEITEDIDLIVCKGIMPARRDNSMWMQDTYMDVLFKIMCHKSKEEVFECIRERIMDLFTRNVVYEDLLIAKKMGAAYESENQQMNLFGRGLKEIGKPVEAGERLEYIIVKVSEEMAMEYTQRDGKVYVGHKMRLPETFVERLESDTPEPIDAFYYVDHLLKNHVEQIFEVGYKKELQKYSVNRDRGVIYRNLKPNKAGLSRTVYAKIDVEPIKCILSLITHKEAITYEINKKFSTGMDCRQVLRGHEHIKKVNLPFILPPKTFDIQGCVNYGVPVKMQSPMQVTTFNIFG